nr:maleylpyruvate isomerase N-terminal domain-containing protein [Rhodococcus ruber]
MHRRRLSEALRRVPPRNQAALVRSADKPTTVTTARLMETWAHGHDVADTLGVTRTPTARLRTSPTWASEREPSRSLSTTRTRPVNPFESNSQCPPRAQDLDMGTRGRT